MFKAQLMMQLEGSIERTLWLVCRAQSNAQPDNLRRVQRKKISVELLELWKSNHYSGEKISTQALALFMRENTQADPFE